MVGTSDDISAILALAMVARQTVMSLVAYWNIAFNEVLQQYGAAGVSFVKIAGPSVTPYCSLVKVARFATDHIRQLDYV